MAEQPPNDLSDFQRARAEAAALLGLDLDRLSATDALRLDVAVVLRRVIDLQTEGAFDGAPVDLNRLMTAIERLTELLPARALTQSHREDPREALLRLFLQMREREQIGERAVEPTLREQIDVLRAENERLRMLAGEPCAIDVPTCDIVPACERAECDPGPRPGPDDPKPRSTVVIEGEVVKPRRTSAPAPKKAAAAPAADVVDLRHGYNDTPEPWRPYTHLYE